MDGVLRKVRGLVVFLMGCICALGSAAQIQSFVGAGGSAFIGDRVGADSICPGETGRVGLTVDGLCFLKDNEYDGEHSNGYTLPGFWVEPRLTWQPVDGVRLEAGFHGLVFDGANRYPCYAYHDIGRWKGGQYQSGAHLLPFLRAEAQVGRTRFVLGDIYGGTRHGLMEPLLNPEVDLSQDPEMGAQVLVGLRHWRMDAWINWQSYIFEDDLHQEVFTVGLSQRLLLNGAGSGWHWYVPLDLVVQHRGGEQDREELGLGVQTLVNWGVGAGLWWSGGGGVLRRLNVEAALIGCWQKDGGLWLYDSGLGGSLMLNAYVGREWRIVGGVVAARRFVSLYGVPFYSTRSLNVEGANFDGVLTPRVGGEWCHDFGGGYVLGARADVFVPCTGCITYADGSIGASARRTVFSFGLYFRCSPHWRLGR